MLENFPEQIQKLIIDNGYKLTQFITNYAVYDNDGNKHYLDKNPIQWDIVFNA